MIARGLPRIFSISAAVLLFSACSGGGAAPTSQQYGGGAQSAFVPESAGIAASASGAPGSIPGPLPEPLVALGKANLSPNLTAPIINDSGSYTNGVIIAGTNTVNGYGVEGITDGSGSGLYGHSGSTSATSYGVYGFSPGGAGVYGYNSRSGSGVLGVSTTGPGVRGASPNADGVLGTTTFASGEGGAANGVEGDDNSTDKGNANAGVLGNSTYGIGVYGNSSNGWGVEGYSSSAVGLFGETQSAVACTNTSEWAFCPAASPALSLSAPGQSASPRGMEIIATNGSQPVMSLDAYGNMVLLGSLVVDGDISYGSLDGQSCDQLPGTCVTPQLSSGRSAPARSVERVGEAQLVEGRAFVALDASLAKAMDPSQSYHVFVTPEGDCNGLYVTGKTGTGFTVRELHRGTATLAFDYRIVATARQVALPRPAQIRAPMPRRHYPAVRGR
ncbi:MAG: hypothetical protein ACLQPV_02710 [Vulcanimicrobiaceae bacterium]